MNKEAVCLSAILAMGSVAAASGAVKPAERPPNVILMLADDLGYGDVGFNGRRDWATPNLDRLARGGLRLTRCYAACPVCAPSRAALMTGRYGIHNGVTANNDDLPSSEVTIAKALKGCGYATALFGKWHHGAPRRGASSYVHPMDRGFDEFIGFTDAVHAWEHFPKQLWFGREMRPVHDVHSDTFFADSAIDFVRRSRARPFFLYLSFNSPHFYIEAPERDVSRYRGKFVERVPDEPYNARYAAMVSRLDAQVGRVMDEVRRQGIERDTIIIFFSDNGATFESGNKGASAFHDSNHPFRGQKRDLWEGGIHVPGIVSWPGHVRAGSKLDAPVHLTDVFPTVLAAAGGTPSPEWHVDGANLLAPWTGKGAVPERTLFWEWRSEGYHDMAAMRGNWKLVVRGSDPPELYDVSADVGERRTLRGQEPAIAGRLLRELRAWLATETDAAREGKPADPAAAAK